MRVFPDHRAVSGLTVHTLLICPLLERFQHLFVARATNRVGDDTPRIALEGENRSERRSLTYAEARRIFELPSKDLIGQMALEC
jgi:hypothetical protein